MARQPTMIMAVQRMTYLKDLGLDHDALVARESEAAQTAGQVELWKGQVDATKNALVLKTDDEIE